MRLSLQLSESDHEDELPKERGADDLFITPQQIEEFKRDPTKAFHLISDSRLQEISNAAATYSGMQGFGVADCVCCGEMFDYKDRQLVSVTADSAIIRNMKERLTAPATEPKLSNDILNYYDIGSRIPALSGLLLNAGGIVSNSGDGPSVVCFCKACKSSLQRRDEKRLPPRFAIANGFWFGPLPHLLSQLSMASLRMCAQASMRMTRTVLSQGRSPYTALHEHVLVFGSDVDLTREELPRLLDEDEEEFKVVFAGQFTDATKISQYKRHSANHAHIKLFLDFLQKNNPLYEQVEINQHNLDKIEKNSDAHIEVNSDAEIGPRDSGYDPHSTPQDTTESGTGTQRASVFIRQNPFEETEILKEVRDSSPT